MAWEVGYKCAPICFNIKVAWGHVVVSRAHFFAHRMSKLKKNALKTHTETKLKWVPKFQVFKM